MRVLVASNMDSTRPFGQYTRPFYLGSVLAKEGWEVGQLGIDTRDVDYGRTWSTNAHSLTALTRLIRIAVTEFAPDLIWAHQNLPAMAALLSRGSKRLPIVADFHSLPSREWRAAANVSHGSRRISHSARYLKALAAERAVSARADILTAAGDSLAEEIRRQLGSRTVRSVPNGIPDDFLGRHVGDDPYDREDCSAQAVAVLPAGVSPANDAALRLLKAAARVVHGTARPITINLLGPAESPSDVSMRHRGFVPDLVPWLAHSDVCLLPYPDSVPLAGGARNKLLEFLAVGQRLVTTQEGLRGFEQAASWPGVVVAEDEPTSFVESIELSLAGDRLLSSRADLASTLTWGARAMDLSQALLAATGAPDPR